MASISQELTNEQKMSKADQMHGLWSWSWLCEKHGSPHAVWSSFLRRCRVYWFWETSLNNWKKGAIFTSAVLAHSCTRTQWILPVDRNAHSFMAWAMSHSEGISCFIAYPPATQATLKRSSICKWHNLSPKLGYFLRVNENTRIKNGRIFIMVIN